jgi:endonuclease/exonuclease/phosphatase family metal-dependent hydrolase
VAPARGRRVHPDGRAADRVLQPPALLRPGPARRVGEVGGDAASPTTTFRVATWNIRAAIGPGEPFPPAWWRHVRRDRLERIAGLIGDLDADIVGLQEVAFLDVDGNVHDQPLDLARLTGRQVRYAAIHAFALIDPDTGRAVGSATWGNALLTRDPVRDGFTLGLPVGPDEDLVEPPGSDLALAGVRFSEAPYGTREPRCAVGGTVQIGDSAVNVMSTHLTYAGSGQRAAQAAVLTAAADQLGGPIVLLGDLNAPIEAPELGRLATGLIDAFGAVGGLPGDPARRSSGPQSIDHILVRDLAVEACHVVREAGDASDHLPIVATLAIG